MSSNDSVTVKLVARKAGVSVATVSRVLNDRTSHLVREETRQKVLRTIEELGYRPNPIARSLKTRSSRTIGIIAPELTNDFFMELAEVIEQELQDRGYSLLIASSSNDSDIEAQRLSLFAERRVDGIILIPAGKKTEQLRDFIVAGPPLILVDRYVEGLPLEGVVSDNITGAWELTRRLIQRRCKHIAFVGGTLDLSPARDRFAGFQKALKEAGISQDPRLYRLGGMEIQDGYKRMTELRKEGLCFDGIFAVNLLVHVGIQRQLLDSPLSQPVPIVAFDESPYIPFFPHCIATAHQNVQEIAKVAVQRLLQRIEEKTDLSQALFPKAPSSPRDIREPPHISIPVQMKDYTPYAKEVAL
ncbi:MAG: LacI family transcriptional regulator [Treponemataceae bacterium]|nr:LacI family transcriptional regulator [Treponemataceae bacterium]